MPLPSELIVAISRAYALTEIIPLQHPTIRDALRSVDRLLHGTRPVTASVTDSGLSVNGERVEDSQGLAREFARDLRAVGATELEVTDDTAVGDVERFIIALRNTISGAQVEITDDLDPDPEGGLSVRFTDGDEARFVDDPDILKAGTLGAGETDGLARAITRLFERADRAEEEPEVDADLAVTPDEESHHGDEEASGEDPGTADTEADEVPALQEEEAPVAETPAAARAPGETGPEPPPAVTPVEEEPSGEPVGEEGGAEEEGEVEGEPGETEPLESGDLVEKVRTFLQADAEERPELARELEEEARTREAEGRLDPVVNAVQTLTRGAVEGTGDDEALELARRLTTPPVAHRFAGRMAGVWDEIERADILEQVRMLASELVEPVAEALSEARDRRARRTYMDAMLAMGETGLEVVEEMLDDPRWFVVRNAVAILGEVGGQRAVEHLTSTLAHDDPRVRRETVLALAKIGGEDAGALVLGKLEDPDADVRAAATRAVGVLKVERAVRPLLERLEEESEAGVMEQVIRSLGQIGDPGAVQAIEKYAVPGFFSRPARDIRIAGYRALASIGTPHARKVLEEARTDRDPEIRKVAEALLDEG